MSGTWEAAGQPGVKMGLQSIQGAEHILDRAPYTLQGCQIAVLLLRGGKRHE